MNLDVYQKTFKIFTINLAMMIEIFFFFFAPKRWRCANLYLSLLHGAYGDEARQQTLNAYGPINASVPEQELKPI